MWSHKSVILQVLARGCRKQLAVFSRGTVGALIFEREELDRQFLSVDDHLHDMTITTAGHQPHAMLFEHPLNRSPATNEVHHGRRNRGDNVVEHQLLQRRGSDRHIRR